MRTGVPVAESVEESEESKIPVQAAKALVKSIVTNKLEVHKNFLNDFIQLPPNFMFIAFLEIKFVIDSIPYLLYTIFYV